jgi:hypothetical protein
MCIIIIIISYPFMQGIYNYIPETNRVSSVYNIAEILYLQFMVHVMLPPMVNVLYFYISTFLSMTTMPNMAVFCSSFIFVPSQYGAHLFSK